MNAYRGGPAVAAGFIAGPALDGNDFITAVIAAPEFRDLGVVSGSGSGYHWYVVDPVRHPLRVWRRKKRTMYAKTAAGLDVSVFSNGPMMGRRHVVGGKVTRKSVPFDLVGSSLLGAG